MNLKDQAIQNLKDFKQILDELKIVFWLDGGTLLGAYRDGDFPPGDEDDIDLCSWINYAPFIDGITAKAEAMGFEIYHKWKRQIAIKRGGSKIDLFFHEKKNHESFHFLYKRVPEDYGGKGIFELEKNGMSWLCIPAVVPAHFFEELTKIDFFGMRFNCPRDAEKYFELKYGADWKTPITRDEYFKRGGCYDPNVNKVLRPDYEI